MIIRPLVIPLVNSYDKTFVGPIVNTKDKDADNNVPPPPSPSITPTITVTPTPSSSGGGGGGGVTPNANWANPPVIYSFTAAEFGENPQNLGASLDFLSDDDVGTVNTIPNYFVGVRIENQFGRSSNLSQVLLLNQLPDISMANGAIEILNSSGEVIFSKVAEIYNYDETTISIEFFEFDSGQFFTLGETYYVRFVPIQPTPPLEINTDGVPATGEVGVFYEGMLTSVGGTGIYEYSIWLNTLPPGLSLEAFDGSITGLPETPGVYEVGIQVDSGVESDQTIITITIT